MNRKNTQRHLRNKIDKWVKTIDDEQLVKDIRKDIVITGGAIVSLLLGEDVQDYDIYFKTKSTTLKVAQYYVKKWKETHKNQDIHAFKDKEDFIDLYCKQVAKLQTENKKESIRTGSEEQIIKDRLGTYFDDRVTIYVPSSGVIGDIDYRNMNNFEDARGYNPENDTREKEYTGEYKPVFITSNAITLSDQIQIIVRFFGEPEEIHKNFDFLHATGYYTDNKLFTTTDILESIMAKELIYRGSKYPLCSIVRLRKFIKRGWTISAGQILKMCMNINDFDLTNVQVMKEQLIGVDSLYFQWLIDIIQQDLREGTISDIDSNYVAELIDKIF